MPLALALALGAAAALGVALLVGRRAPFLAPGVGLVLLLVAALRALGDAGYLLGSGVVVTDELVVGAPVVDGLVAVGLLVGGGAWLAVRRREAVSGPVGALAVVLAQAPLLAWSGSGTYDTYFSQDGPPSFVPTLLLAGALAGGAVAAVRPGLPAAVAAVPLLAGGSLLAGHVDPLLLRAPCAGLALGVLVPLLLDRCRAATGDRVAAGALVGVVVVLVAAALPGLLEGGTDGLPRRYADYASLSPATPGLQVVSNEQYGDMSAAYSSTLQIALGGPPPLVPGLSLLLPGAGRPFSVRIAG